MASSLIEVIKLNSSYFREYGPYLLAPCYPVAFLLQVSSCCRLCFSRVVEMELVKEGLEGGRVGEFKTSKMEA